MRSEWIDRLRDAQGAHKVDHVEPFKRLVLLHNIKKKELQNEKKIFDADVAFLQKEGGKINEMV